VKINPAGRVTGEFELSPDAAPFDIAAQTDGSIWLTSRGDAAIWRIPTDGSKPREFQLAEGSIPALIAVGPDGNVWFTDISGKIGRITASGTVSEFVIVAD
jgi:streptogramin lyase